MKTLLTLLLCTLTLSLVAVAADAKAKQKDKGKTQLRHVVAFKFKADATPEQIQKVQDAFKALNVSIPQIRKFESGVNNSPEKLNKGCTHGYILTFKSEKDRDDYLVHPEHKKFGALVGPTLDDVFVLDFWAD